MAVDQLVRMLESVQLRLTAEARHWISAVSGHRLLSVEQRLSKSAVWVIRHSLASWLRRVGRATTQAGRVAAGPRACPELP